MGLCTALALAASLFPVARARGTTMVRMSLEQLSQASSVIVRGHVVSAESHWNAAHTRIMTYTMVAVDQAMKGSPGATVVVQQLGGTVGNRHVYVPGSARLEPQASYLLFLEPAESSRYVVVGMEQGAYRITRDTKTGREIVIQPTGEFHVGAAAGVTMEGMPLSQFQPGLSRAIEAPVVIPAGTSLPLVIESVESDGVGRLQVLARTTHDIFPSAKSVVPAGSAVAGAAQLVVGVWKIRWAEVMVRGTEIPIRATSEEPHAPNGADPLRGRQLVVRVR